MSDVVDLFPSFIHDDLANSGLKIADLGVRPMGPSEKQATGAPATSEGYVIPYYDIYGKPVPFYRVKIRGGDPKYRQLADQGNYIYFPKGFWDLAQEAPYIVFTEGEKKAGLMVKCGFAACAAGGVDSWSNRVLQLPKDAKLSKGSGGKLLAKLPSGAETDTENGELARGMDALIALLIRRDIPLIIVYDSNTKGEVGFQVQSAAARLGYSLRFHGVAARNIRQFIIKPPPGYNPEIDEELAQQGKYPSLGLDDLLVETEVSPEQLDKALRGVCEKASAFPVHPNPREYVNKKLRRGRMVREQLQSLATAIICDMDAQGTRLHSKDEDELYYFSKQTHQLIRASFKLSDDFSKTPFGVYLYQKYNLSIADDRILTWLGTLYAGEAPLAHVSPERVLTVQGDTLYYQISAGQMLRVNAQEVRVLDNGADGVLFQSGVVQDLNKTRLVKAINGFLNQKGPMKNIWADTIAQTRIADDSEGRQTKLLSYLYSISPWFYRWRGTQLPIEMVCGEPGSGKSTLYVLRQNILTGDPRLRNPPKDITDWGVSVGSVGGLHVIDNVNLANTGLRQEMSDEMCRLITEPFPMIEKRKLYSDTDTVKINVKTVFAVTSVKQPFQNPDIIQRSIITWMNKGTEAVEYHGDWAQDRLDQHGGREAWVAHQMVFIHRLFGLIRDKWDKAHRAKYRLKNVEQLLALAAEVYGEPSLGDGWITSFIEETQSNRIAENDVILGALRAYAEARINKYGEGNRSVQATFSAKDIAEQMAEHADYRQVFTLTNSRALGRHMKQNPNLLATVAGITEAGTRANATVYYAHTPKT